MVPAPLAIRTPGYRVALVSHPSLARRGTMNATEAVVLSVPLMPLYAPVPEPATIGIGAVADPSAEHPLLGSGVKVSRLPRSPTLISNEPFERTSLLIVPVGSTPW